jgi:hypothetical protein
MNIFISIECDNHIQLQSHLSIIKTQFRKEAKKLSLSPDDEFPISTKVSDDNCYGTHTASITENIDVFNPFA